jgi:RNA polymerase sigma-70 factor (ECF subfamily)
MDERNLRMSFEHEILPHLDSAYNLALWLTRNEHDAQDVVQEAYIRAYRFFGNFRGGRTRPWLLKIVRNTCYTWLHQNRKNWAFAELDENQYAPDPLRPNPEAALIKDERNTMLRDALERLPRQLREVLILRELEGLSYKEIAKVTGRPAGTVMSRLSRARGELRESLSRQTSAAGLLTSAKIDSGYLSGA